MKASAETTAKVARTIHEIAARTNLLAMNAQIDAARGRGGPGLRGRRQEGQGTGHVQRRRRAFELSENLGRISDSSAGQDPDVGEIARAMQVVESASQEELATAQESAASAASLDAAVQTQRALLAEMQLAPQTSPDGPRRQSLSI